jgi:aspartate/methionine/tyrosine aminotransferase
MQKFPIPPKTVANQAEQLHITSWDTASIREIVALVNNLEAETGERFVRMEMGVPGLPPAQIGVDAEIEALRNGVASIYPLITGAPKLLNAASRFIKLFMDIDVAPASIVPTVGSMEATYAALLTVGNLMPKRDTTLFLDPGFPVQKQQMQVMGCKYERFDMFDFRGDKLRNKLENILSQGHINAVIYSNPNNPSWICLTEDELQIIGELATKYDVIVLEDLAYFAMDFRKDLYTPGRPPYQATVARYTDNYVLFISASKIFSYAGQRIALMAMSDTVFRREYDNLQTRFGSRSFGHTVIYKILYALTSGTGHSAQIALTAMLEAANNGKFNFVNDIRDYAEKAAVMKQLFTDAGFRIIYEMDGDQPISDGFYFTIGYPGISGGELLNRLLHCGISAITLKGTGSEREGLRACVSHVRRDQFDALAERLKIFRQTYC